MNTIETPGTKKSPLRPFLIIGGIVGAIVVVAAVLLLSGLIRFSSADPGATDLFEVRRDDLPITVLESGNLKALKSLDLKCEVEGGSSILSIVDEGTVVTEEDVKNGKILIELDSSSLGDKENQQDIVFRNAESALTTAKSNYDIQVNQNESDIKAGELNVEFAGMDLNKYLGDAVSKSAQEKERAGEKIDFAELIRSAEIGGAALQQRRILESDIQLAQEERSRAESRYEGTKGLHDKGYVSKDELDADDLARKRCNVEVERTGTALDLFLRYEFEKQAKQLLSDYREAERELERIKDRADSKDAQAKAELDSKQKTYALQKSQLEKIREQIKKCTIRATEPGLVIYAGAGDPWRQQQKPIAKDAAVTFRQVLISLPDLSVMAIDVKVHEASVKKVKKGQKATIKLDAFPDLILTGMVSKVSDVPDSQRINPDLKVYSTEVILEGEYPNLKPGFTAKVTIIAEELKNVLQVPVQAVYVRNNVTVCYVAKGGYFEARPVLMGAAGDKFVQIVKGLDEGEKVLLREPLAGENIEDVEPSFTPPAKPQEEQEAAPKPATPQATPGNGGQSTQPTNGEAGGQPEGQTGRNRRRTDGQSGETAPAMSDEMKAAFQKLQSAMGRLSEDEKKKVTQAVGMDLEAWARLAQETKDMDVDQTEQYLRQKYLAE
jgi:HlyD family secretion protein